MCGICGIINFDNEPINDFSIRNMMKIIKHRGPDDEGLFIENNIGFGFVRLSILDLTLLGHQPMFSNYRVNMRTFKKESAKNLSQMNFDHDNIGNQRYVIVYNGEVYNYKELREELIEIGYEFKSNTDTEVVLNSYIEWGEDSLEKFNGMWAIAIYDREKEELFCVRDRYGIKPLYYYIDDKQFIFASEILPIFSVLKEKPSPNNQAIFDFLVFNRTDQTENTFFKDIKKLQHGCSMRIGLKNKNQKYEIKKWYDLKKELLR